MHYPTDISLLWDALRKVIKLTAKLCEKSNMMDYRQYCHNTREVKRLFRLCQKANKIKNDTIKKQAYENYLEKAQSELGKAIIMCNKLSQKGANTEEVQKFIGYGCKQMDLINRRVLKGEEIPHEEKIHSLFQPHTEWRSKGKAGVPVELGVPVTIMEDQFGFILGSHIMWNQTDSKVPIPFVKKMKKQYPNLFSCSFDKGYHSPENQEKLAEIINEVYLPQKGRKSQARQEFEGSEDFKKAKRHHSGIESAINCLNHHGLSLCRDHGRSGFSARVSCAIVGMNLRKIGQLAIQKEAKKMTYQRQKLAA